MGAERQFTSGYAIPPGWPMGDNRQVATTELMNMNSFQGSTNAYRTLAVNNPIFTQNKRPENQKSEPGISQPMNMVNVMNSQSPLMNIKPDKVDVKPTGLTVTPAKTIHKQENVVMFENRKPKPLKQPPPNAPSLPYVCAICDQGKMVLSFTTYNVTYKLH